MGPLDGIRVIEMAGLAPVPYCGMMLADFGAPERARAADAHLRSRGVIVRAMGAYGLPGCLRITVGTGEECTLLADALAGFRHD